METDSKQPGGASSLTRMTTCNPQLLDVLSSAVGEANSKSTFACGGSIPIILDRPPGSSDANIAFKLFNQAIATRPVTIRYGSSGSGQILKLPTDTAHDPTFLSTLLRYRLGGQADSSL